ncbi:type II toxin-antitoxin system VapC family toxin [Kribbella sp. NPDC050124]|uniref:type II toxin-antitoxin system VapC family toxin n=1 Tax=Kribbella sp. NPDC050124 TaxID=3364114 RepID=UPI0037A9A9E6
MNYLLDTNVVSEFRKKAPHAGASGWISSVRSSDLYLSVLVVGELRQGIERLATRDQAQARGIDEWTQRLVKGYGDRIIPVTVEVAETWGRLNARSPLPLVDGLLAATALAYDWTLVTGNVADVARTGVRLLNPFELAAQ